MHEAAVAQSLYEVIVEQSARHRGKAVRAKISCGSFQAVNDELLNEAYQAITRGSEYADVVFEIEHKPVMGKCRSCDSEFEFDFRAPACPACGSEDFALLPDAPLVLEEIEFQTE